MFYESLTIYSTEIPVTVQNKPFFEIVGFVMRRGSATGEDLTGKTVREGEAVYWEAGLKGDNTMIPNATLRLIAVYGTTVYEVDRGTTGPDGYVRRTFNVPDLVPGIDPTATIPFKWHVEAPEYTNP